MRLPDVKRKRMRKECGGQQGGPMDVIADNSDARFIATSGYIYRQIGLEIILL